MGLASSPVGSANPNSFQFPDHQTPPLLARAVQIRGCLTHWLPSALHHPLAGKNTKSPTNGNPRSRPLRRRAERRGTGALPATAVPRGPRPRAWARFPDEKRIESSSLACANPAKLPARLPCAGHHDGERSAGAPQALRLAPRIHWSVSTFSVPSWFVQQNVSSPRSPNHSTSSRTRRSSLPFLRTRTSGSSPSVHSARPSISQSSILSDSFTSTRTNSCSPPCAGISSACSRT